MYSKKNEVKSVVASVITTDQHHGATAKLFRGLAEQSAFDLQIETFTAPESATHWMSERIRPD